MYVPRELAITTAAEIHCGCMFVSIWIALESSLSSFVSSPCCQFVELLRFIYTSTLASYWSDEISKQRAEMIQNQDSQRDMFSIVFLNSLCIIYFALVYVSLHDIFFFVFKSFGRFGSVARTFELSSYVVKLSESLFELRRPGIKLTSTSTRLWVKTLGCQSRCSFSESTSLTNGTNPLLKVCWRWQTSPAPRKMRFRTTQEREREARKNLQYVQRAYAVPDLWAILRIGILEVLYWRCGEPVPQICQGRVVNCFSWKHRGFLPMSASGQLWCSNWSANSLLCQHFYGKTGTVPVRQRQARAEQLPRELPRTCFSPSMTSPLSTPRTKQS